MSKEVRHIILNGEFLPSNASSIMHNNRSFCYGDALFETMHAYQDKVQFFADHYQRLTTSMLLLGMHIPEKFNEDFFYKQIISLLKKNRIYQGARIRLCIYRNCGGFYTPESNSFSFLIEANPLESVQYGAQQKGLRLGLYETIRKPINILSPLKTSSALMYVLAGVFKKENNFDECIIVNERGYIAETISSNIFFVRGKNIATPPITDGCIDGVMRKNIIRIAKNMNYNVIDDVAISMEYINTVDEIFLTNAVKGVQWVLGFEKRRFFHDASASILIKLNEEVFNS